MIIPYTESHPGVDCSCTKDIVERCSEGLHLELIALIAEFDWQFGNVCNGKEDASLFR